MSDDLCSEREDNTCEQSGTCSRCLAVSGQVTAAIKKTFHGNIVKEISVFTFAVSLENSGEHKS